MKAPEGYSGPTPQLIEYDIKNDAISEVVSKFLKTSILKSDKVGIFQKDKEDDQITKITLKAISDTYKTVDMSSALS
jgi:hypothetical protein